MTPNAIDQQRLALTDVLAALDEFLAERTASHLSDDQKAMTKTGIKHLKAAMAEAGVPLLDFVSSDGLAPYIARESQKWSVQYLNHLRDIWRQSFRHLCRKGFLALAYDRCVVPAQEQKDPHRFDRCERGYPEAWLGVYPRSILPPPTLKSIEANAKVSDGVKHDYDLVQENTNELKRDATRAVYWFLIRQMALDMNLGSLRELGTVEGAVRLGAYFVTQGYHRHSNTIMKIRTIFNTLQALGVCEENPFKMKHRVGEVLRWAIDFSKLPEVSLKQRYLRINGKRHIKDQGQMVECWLHPDEVKKISAFGNPALQSWDGLSERELEGRFREAQENEIARTVLFNPSRPLELFALNWKDWTVLEDDPNKEFMMLLNNAIAHARKRRPDRVVPVSYVRALEQLWRLRRAAFAAKGDMDMKESFNMGLLRPGIALWVNPKTGARLTAPCLKRALRAALLRMGIKPERARRATIYWIRKGHQTFARNHAKGLGDKFIAEQAGHSEMVLRKFYDSPDALARGEHLRDNIWAPLGVVPAAKSEPTRSGSARPPAVSASAQHIDGASLSRLTAELFDMLREQGIAIDDKLPAADLDRITASMSLRAGLLCSYQEAATMLNVDLRTIERWEERKIIRPIRLDGHRHLLKAQVKEIAQSLSPEEAGKHLGLTGRQVRNLIHDGKIQGAIPKGRNFLLPRTSVLAYQTAEA